MRRPVRPWPFWVTTFVLGLCAVRGVWRLRTAADVLPPPGRPVLVKHVDESGTLQLAGEVRVRLIGIEYRASTTDAVAFLRAAASGRHVHLEYDRERLDEFGRVWAYVSLDGSLLNEELLRRGLARVDPLAALRSAERRRFTAAQEEARHHQRRMSADRTVLVDR